MFRTLLVLAMMACIASCAPSAGSVDSFSNKSGNVTILGDMTVTGALRTTSIRSNQLTVDGSISVTNDIESASLNAQKAKVTVLETSVLSSPTGSVQVSGDLNFSDAPISALELDTTVLIQNDVKQWQMVHHDTFDAHADGWNTDERSSCEGSENYHLAGHCKHVGNEVTKTFKNLPAHRLLRLQARYHFLDSWEGESAFAKANGQIVWADSNDASDMHPHALNICGGSHPDRRFSTPIDVTFPHTGDYVEISFGATLDEHPCNESFGVRRRHDLCRLNLCLIVLRSINSCLNQFIPNDVICEKSV